MENSREIKFRGQRVDNKEWVYGNFIQTSVDKKTNPKFTAGIQIFKDGEFKGVFQVLPETVGQFTGLKDKKGVEIYEGDVIKTERNIVVVSFGKKEYKIKIYDDFDIIEINGWLVTNKNGHSETLDSSFCEGEVIGNIHDNPELLNYL